MVPTMNDQNARLQSVSDTARWVAHFRALETRRPDALFHDAHAERLAGERGFQRAEMLAQGTEQGTSYGWAWVARTFQFDSFLSSSLRDGADLVLNLAA